MKLDIPSLSAEFEAFLDALEDLGRVGLMTRVESVLETLARDGPVETIQARRSHDGREARIIKVRTFEERLSRETAFVLVIVDRNNRTLIPADGRLATAGGEKEKIDELVESADKFFADIR